MLLFDAFLEYIVSAEPQKAVQVQNLQPNYVVSNPVAQEHSVSRCGQVDTNQACLLYIMNASRSDKLGRDFFEQASNVMGVPVYTIRINNPDYSERLIRPGYLTEIYIPKR